MRIGHGYDVHKLVKDRPLIIGGIRIDCEFGLLGHSDADVCLHAIMDAILGALALGDIGKHFSDQSAEFKDIDSKILLKKVKGMMQAHHYEIGNIDVTIIAQKPKLSPYIEDMRKTISSILDCNYEQINIKATTEEGLGFTGTGKGIASHAVCLLNKAII